jgi:glycosyltransferase involved in cell wall biosynthesis
MQSLSKAGVEVITLKKKGVNDFAKERNNLLSRTTSEWVFFLDSDEVITKELEKEIFEVIRKSDAQGYFVTRKDFFFGKELKYGEFSTHGWFGNSRILRLGRKNAGNWKRIVHEYWDIKGNKGILKNPLLHYPHRTLKRFVSNINHFSTLHAQALKTEGKKVGLLKIVIWPTGKFIYNYIFRLGFLDGMQGFVAALIMSFHSFLSWTKLYFLRS